MKKWYWLRKLINLRFASSDYTAIYTKDKVDYVILDDYYNPNLVRIMNEDKKSFILLKNETDSRPFSSEKFNVYLFYYKDYYNFFSNPTFEYESPEWFLDMEKNNETLNRSDFDPYEGDYSLLYNKSYAWPRTNFKSKALTLASQYNYSFSCYLKYIKYSSSYSSITIRFFINYYDSDYKLISQENVYILSGLNNSIPYSFLNFTFPIISGSYIENIEIKILTSPQRKAIILLDNICLTRSVWKKISFNII